MNRQTHLLELRDIWHIYPDGSGHIEVLKGINLQLEAGKMTAIMGPSGSGKTTLLKVAGGLLTPSRGQVLFEGTPVNTLNGPALAAHRRRHVGYVFQDYNLIENLTALENVSLPLELDGVPASQARDQARESLRMMDVSDLADRWAGDLSGGQAQRVAVARALVGEGRLLLADEPTGALDTVASDQVMSLLRERVDMGATCLLVTHEPRLAAWADDIVYLRDGRFISAEEYRMLPPVPSRGYDLDDGEDAPQAGGSDA